MGVCNRQVNISTEKKGWLIDWLHWLANELFIRNGRENKRKYKPLILLQLEQATEGG